MTSITFLIHPFLLLNPAIVTFQTTSSFMKKSLRPFCTLKNTGAISSSCPARGSKHFYSTCTGNFFSCRPATWHSPTPVLGTSSFGVPFLSSFLLSPCTRQLKTTVFFSNQSDDHDDVTRTVLTSTSSSTSNSYNSSSSSHGSNTSTAKTTLPLPSETMLQLTPEEIAASLGPDRQIATKPFSWEELKWIVQHGDPTMHSRSMEVQGKYLLHSRQVKNMWGSMNDYILYSKFGFDKVLDEENTGKYVSKPSLQELKIDKRVEKRLLRNEYPYYVSEGIEHWCLWKLGGKVEACDIDMAVEQMKKNDDYEQVLAWVNPAHLQSIPDIDHAHLLCLRSVCE